VGSTAAAPEHHDDDIHGDLRTSTAERGWKGMRGNIHGGWKAEHMRPRMEGAHDMWARIKGERDTRVKMDDKGTKGRRRARGSSTSTPAQGRPWKAAR
jgi:hypothetical protein